jgi:hypothetical protein
MAITLKEETILNEWSIILDHGAGHEAALLTSIQERMREAAMPNCHTWALEEVQSSGLFSKVRRELIVVRQEQFTDYRMYIGVRAYGIHLDCCRFLTVEPGFMKKWAAEKLTGASDALSAPKNILIHQDLRAWATVVHHAVLSSVEELMKKLNQDTALLQRGSKGFLEIW